LPARDTVSICIASIGRTSLVPLLRSLEAMQWPRSKMRVIVADDSADGSARRLIDDAGPWRLPIEVHPVAARNIATARNTCLDHVQGQFAAFVDDDELVHPDWLAQLHKTATTYNADAVFGAVDAIYSPTTPSWLRKVGLFRKRPGATGERVITGITGNALVRFGAVRQMQLRFNEDFGRTGGEDTDFFHRLSAAGGTLVACADAIVYEHVPPERLEIQHLRKRYTRGGYTYARVMLAQQGPLQRALFYGAALGKMLVTGLMSLAAWPVRRDLGLIYATRYWGHIGKLLYAARRPSPQIYWECRRSVNAR
jgi:succinoglycan biosynthesis protein ExoM